MLPPLPDTSDAATIATGEGLFGRFCGVCHGEAAVGGGVVPDLRKSPYLPVDAWYNIVLDGILKTNGMAPFGPVLDRSKATAIRAYVIHRANEDNTASAEGKSHQPDVEPRRSHRGTGYGGRRPALRAVPCLQWRFRCQRRVPAARLPASLLPRGTAARLQLRNSAQRDHVADRQGACQKTISRMSRPTMLMSRRRSCRWRPRQTPHSSAKASSSPKPAARRRGFPAAATAMARTARGSRPPYRISADNTATTSPSS